MATAGTCARCNRTLVPGDRVLEVRVVSRIHPGGTASHDRGDALVHLDCPDRADRARPTTFGPPTRGPIGGAGDSGAAP